MMPKPSKHFPQHTEFEDIKHHLEKSLGEGVVEHQLRRQRLASENESITESDSR